jgi:glycosyltransferase involved in cell wall biosynthesis
VGINKEDFEASKKMPLRGKALYVPGVGIDVDAIRALPKNRIKYCSEFGIPEDAVIYVSVGELIPRKNHIAALQAFSKADINNGYYIICGFGQLDQELKSEAVRLGILDKVIFSGFRLDAKEIMRAADVFVFPSFQEGLSVALMEAMACSLPCISSNIRGNVDLIDVEKGGLLFEPNDVETFAEHLKNLAENSEVRAQYGAYNSIKIKTYDLKNVQEIMRKEYVSLLQG